MIKKHSRKIFVSIFLFLFLLNILVLVPYNVKYTYAQGALNSVGSQLIGPGDPQYESPDYGGGDTSSSNNETGWIGCDGAECDVYDFFRTLDNIIQEALKIAIAFVAVIFAYAGWIYVTANGDSGKISRAHGMFFKAMVGFVIALTAFLLVRLFVTTLGADENLIIDLADRNR